MPTITKISDLIKESPESEKPKAADEGKRLDGAEVPESPPECIPKASSPSPPRRPPRHFWYIFVAALLLIAAVGVGWQLARNYQFLDNFGVVEVDLIYRAGQLKPFQLEKLIKEYKIKTIIKTNIPELALQDMAREQIICNRNNVRVVHLIMPGDGRGEFEQFDQAVDLLADKKNLPALITCARGAYRTGAIVACYRVRVQSWPIKRAFAEMESYRFDPYRRGRGDVLVEEPLLAHLRAYFKERTGYEE